MEKDHLGEAFLVLVKAQERVGQEREVWVAPRQVQSLVENASASNVELFFLMKQEYPVILRNVPNVVRQW